MPLPAADCISRPSAGWSRGRWAPHAPPGVLRHGGSSGGYARYHRTPISMMSCGKWAPLKLIAIVVLPHDAPLVMKGEHTANGLTCKFATKRAACNGSAPAGASPVIVLPQKGGVVIPDSGCGCPTSGKLGGIGLRVA